LNNLMESLIDVGNKIESILHDKDLDKLSLLSKSFFEFIDEV